MARVPLVLEVDLSREPVEVASGPFWLRPSPPTLFEVEQAVLRGSRDPRIAGLLVRLDFPPIGWSKAECLHRAVRAFRKASKPSIAFVGGGGSTALLVASAASRVLLDPSTTLDVQSLSSETFFVKDVLDELGVSAEIDQVGEFKSAAEVFLRTESSAAHRQQIDEILKDFHDLFVRGVAEGRGLAPEEVDRALRRGPFLPEEAIAEGLADGVAHPDEVVEALAASLGRKPKRIGFRRYVARGRMRRLVSRFRARHVAVLHVSGVITLGDSRQSVRGLPTSGARHLTDLLTRIRESRRIRALVVRVDSPGGGAVASDRIRRELELTARVKPVVISMGDVAASGGYYIATASESVVAESSTLTGSIGVVGGKFALARLLDRLSIHREVRATGENARFYSAFQSFGERERKRNREFLRHFYEKKFVPAVASGRKLDYAEADRLGRGRVWTGRQAHERGLVDRLGGLEDAIEIACARAGLARGKACITFATPRRRLRNLVPSAASALRPPGLALVSDSLALLEELAREELWLLMPRLFRVR